MFSFFLISLNELIYLFDGKKLCSCPNRIFPRPKLFISFKRNCKPWSEPVDPWVRIKRFRWTTDELRMWGVANGAPVLFQRNGASLDFPKETSQTDNNGAKGGVHLNGTPCQLKFFRLMVVNVSLIGRYYDFCLSYSSLSNSLVPLKYVRFLHLRLCKELMSSMAWIKFKLRTCCTAPHFYLMIWL